MKRPANLDEIAADCADYFSGKTPKGIDDFTRCVTIPLRRRAFAAKSPEYVKALLAYIAALERDRK